MLVGIKEKNKGGKRALGLGALKPCGKRLPACGAKLFLRKRKASRRKPILIDAVPRPWFAGFWGGHLGFFVSRRLLVLCRSPGLVLVCF